MGPQYASRLFRSSIRSLESWSKRLVRWLEDIEEGVQDIALTMQGRTKNMESSLAEPNHALLHNLTLSLCIQLL